jgi:hypothetical protein
MEEYTSPVLCMSDSFVSSGLQRKAAYSEADLKEVTFVHSQKGMPRQQAAQTVCDICESETLPSQTQ